MKQNYEGILKRFERVGRKLEDIGFEMTLREWKQQIRGGSLKTDDLEAQMRRVFFSRRLFDLVMGQSRRTDLSPMERRRWQLWKKSFVSSRIGLDKEVCRLGRDIMNAHVNLRVEFEGKQLGNNNISQFLSTEPSGDKRREVWLKRARAAQPTEKDLISLMRLRNSMVREWGYRDLVHFQLSMQDVEKRFIDGEAARYFKLVRPLVERVNEMMQRELKLDRVFPWDAAFAQHRMLKKFHEAFPPGRGFPSLKKAMASIGVEVDKLPLKIDAEPRPTKTYGGLCEVLRIPDDIRLLFYPFPGFGSYGVVYHEFGHGLHHCRIEEKDFIFKGAEAPLAEGIAEFMAMLPLLPEWWKIAMGSKLRRPPERLFDLQRSLSRVGNARQAASYLFQSRVYESDARCDFEKLYRKGLSDVLLADIPESVEEHLWPGSIMLSSHPVYDQNYFIADMFAAQNMHFLQERFGKILGNRAIAGFLSEEYFADGYRTPWHKKVVHATGEPLTSKYLVANIGR